MTPEERGREVAQKFVDTPWNPDFQNILGEQIAQALRDHGNERLEAAALLADIDPVGAISHAIRALKDEPAKDAECRVAQEQKS